jgi:Zn-dependent M28 family amino/carboxypeptidase
MTRARLTFAALAAGLALAAPCSAADVRTAAALRDRALTDPTAWNLLESLTTEIGPRPVGSPAYNRARDWGLAKLKALGFANVHAEAFAKPSWQRGAESAEIVAPFPQRLAIIGLGNSVPTPPNGIEAPVVVLKSYAELLAAKPGAFKGKIVVVNQPMARTQDGAGYGAAVEARNGDAEAAKRGAVAYLLRSVSTSTNRSPHTGAIWGHEKEAHIPAAALGVPDADLLERMAARGPVRVRLKLASWVDQKSVAWNISGEITGSARLREVIVIGGHYDSWDPGTGAIDDGAGVAITTAAATLIGRLPQHPRRTIRVVLFGSEESGGSSDAYLAAHRKELGNIVITSEADLGSDRAYNVKLPVQNAPALIALPTVLAPLGVFVSPDAPTHGGSDISGLQKAGVPIFSIGQDASRYFDYHHSADDTLAIVDRAQLNQNVATWAGLLYLIADSSVDFRAKPTN